MYQQVVNKLYSSFLNYLDFNVPTIRLFRKNNALHLVNGKLNFSQATREHVCILSVVEKSQTGIITTDNRNGTFTVKLSI